MFDTKLSDFKDFDYKNVIFYKPETINLSDSQNIFRKIKIGVKNKDGTFGDLVFSAPKGLFSFGIQELKDANSGNINGYIMPISLWRRKEPSDDELAFIEVLQSIINASQDKVQQFIDDNVDTKRFSPLSYKKPENENEDKKSPILYTKLIFNKKDGKISTLFIDEHSNIEINPLSILNKKCYITGAIKIESIFLGEKVTLQVKLYEAIVRVIKNSKRLLTNESKNKK